MNATFRAAVAELESLQGPVSRLLVERLSSADAEDVAWFRERFFTLGDGIRYAAISSMVESAEADFELDYRELFRVALDDVLPTIRRLAIEGLWEDERLDLLRRFLALLENDPAEEVRAAAASSLGRYVYMAECEELDQLRAVQVRQALEQAVAEGPLEVARRALESLAFVNDDRVTRLIDAAYADPRPLMRQSALFAMGRNADRFWAETVLAELHSEDPAMRYEAARASGELQLSRAVPALGRLISDDRDVEVQGMAIWALGEIGGKRAREILERLVESDNEAWSAAAEDALEAMQLADGEFDMFVFETDDEESLLRRSQEPHEADQLREGETVGEEEEEGEDETPAHYRKDFERYLDEDESSDDRDMDDEEWPDEFLERT